MTATGHQRGALTFAYGDRRYVTMAQTLARTIRLHNPDLHIAIVTDSTDQALQLDFDAIVPLVPDFGPGHLHKLHLDFYSPYDRTMYIDADSLVVRSLDEIWELFAAVPFGVEGSPMREGEWFADVGALLRERDLPALPRFNGGLMYFDRSEKARAVFARARALIDVYTESGFRPMASGQRNDEPLIALALAEQGIEAIDDGGRAMRTPIGLRGRIDIDVLEGRCRFEKYGVVVEPAIAHFCGWRVRGFYYRRERLKLQLASGPARTGRGGRTAVRLVDALCNPPHAAVMTIASPFLPPIERALRAWRDRPRRAR